MTLTGRTIREIALVAAMLAPGAVRAQVLVGGRVVDGSGGPLGGVLVQLAVKGLSTTTGADGTFELRDDATVLPQSSSRFGVSTIELCSGVFSVVAGPRGARIGARLYDARGRAVSVLFKGILRPGAVLRAPVFGKTAAVARGVYLLDVNIDGAVGQYKMLNVGGSAQPSLLMTSPAALAKTLAVADTLRLSRNGCTTKNVLLEQYSVELGDVAMSCGGADLLTIPKIEFLKSDEPNPGSIAKYVSDRNRGNGSGSSAANAQEVQAALNGASPGQTFLAVSQTPGAVEFWGYPAGLKFPNGASGSPVTLQARSGDGIVLTKSNQFAPVRTPKSGAWTQTGLSQADKDMHIWKSTEKYTGKASLFGVWYEFGYPHILLPYGTLDRLRTPYQNGHSGDTYATPGAVLHTDGYVYIRMQKPHPDKYSADRKWSPMLWPGHPEAVSNGALNYPITQDPNDYVIYLYEADYTIAFQPVSSDGGFFKIGSGINSMGYREVVTGSNITMRRGTHLPWFAFMIGGSKTRINYDIQRARIALGSMRHTSRAEWKFGGWLEGYRSVFTGPTGQFGGVTGNLCFKNVTICDFHELMVGGNSKYRFLHCTIFNILDDGIQADPSLSQVEIGYCYLLYSAFGGNGGYKLGSDPNPGQWYFHHNVIDARTQKGSDWGIVTTPPFLWMNHSAGNSQPRKNYNNTVLWGPDVEVEQRNGFNHNSNQNNTLSKAHEVFNNLFIRHDTQRYDAGKILSNVYGSYGQCDEVGANASVGADASNEYWDYNLYYRDLPKVGGQYDGYEDALLKDWRIGKDKGVQQFNSLDDYRNSSLFALSKQGGALRGPYAPGFEAHGTDVRPSLASLDDMTSQRFNYRPSPTAAVTVATDTSLSGEDWWSGSGPSWGKDYFPWEGLAPNPWKGALDPNGTEMTVGVLNP